MSQNLDEWNKPKREVATAEFDREIKLLQKRWGEYEAQKKIASELYKDYEEQESVVINLFKTAGKRNYQVEGFGTGYIIEKYVVRTPKDNEAKRKFFDFLRQRGGDEFFLSTVSVNHQTLQSYYNQEKAAAAGRGEAIFEVPGLEPPTLVETLGFRKK